MDTTQPAGVATVDASHVFSWAMKADGAGIPSAPDLVLLLRTAQLRESFSTNGAGLLTGDLPPSDNYVAVDAIGGIISRHTVYYQSLVGLAESDKGNPIMVASHR